MSGKSTRMPSTTKPARARRTRARRACGPCRRGSTASMRRDPLRPLRPLRKEALGIAIILTVFQIWMVCLLAPGTGVAQSYSNLCVWDCRWYESIARDGYHSTVPPVRQDTRRANVAFFPAYPYASRFLFLSFGLNPRIGLLIL